MQAQLLIILLLTFNLTYGQELEIFEFSKCLKDQASDSSKVIYFQSYDNTDIEFLTYAPCNGNFIGNFELKNNLKLNLTFKPKPVKLSNGEEMIEIADCNCLYKFKYRMTGIPPVSIESITFNDKSLLEIDKENIGQEIEVQIDD